jgi:hypothetical protein
MKLSRNLFICFLLLALATTGVPRRSHAALGVTAGGFAAYCGIVGGTLMILIGLDGADWKPSPWQGLLVILGAVILKNESGSLEFVPPTEEEMKALGVNGALSSSLLSPEKQLRINLSLDELNQQASRATSLPETRADWNVWTGAWNQIADQNGVTVEERTVLLSLLKLRAQRVGVVVP